MYTLLYYVHVIAVCLSGSFFLVRGIWMLTDSDLLNARWVRISPHIIDTVLLAAAIGLAVIVQQYPVTHDWLTVKLVALIAYIGLGVFALRRGRTKAIRAVFLVLALLTFAFMVSVALTHEPLGILA